MSGLGLSYLARHYIVSDRTIPSTCYYYECGLKSKPHYNAKQYVYRVSVRLYSCRRIKSKYPFIIQTRVYSVASGLMTERFDHGLWCVYV